jgi:signal transduction histidine kinase/predicted negative regulator of RcsB-dependent stress response
LILNGCEITNILSETQKLLNERLFNPVRILNLLGNFYPDDGKLINFTIFTIPKAKKGLVTIFIKKGDFFQIIRWGLILIWAANGVFCQTPHDSLRSVLHNLTGPDRIHTLNLLSQEYIEEDPEIALAYAIEADSLSMLYNDLPGHALANKNLGDIRFNNNDFVAAIAHYDIVRSVDTQAKNYIAVADDLYLIAIAYEQLNNYEKALSYYKKAFKVCDSIGEYSIASTLLYNIGYLYDNIGEKIKALEYYRQSLKISESLNDHEEVAATLNAIGLLYYSWGDYEPALNNYQQSLTMMEKAGNKSGMAQALNNLGILFYDWGQKEQALNYYLTSLKLEEEAGNKAGLAGSYNNIGIVYVDLKNHNKALEYYQKALQIDKEFDNELGIATCLNNLGDLYFEMGDQQQAIEMLNQALTIERKIGNPENIANNYNTLGGFYHKMGKQKMAQFYIDSSYQLINTITSPELLLNNYLLSCQIYESLGSYKHALEYHKKYHDLHDSLFSKNTMERISVIRSKYEVDRHEKEIELLSSKNQLQVLELENKQMILHRQRVIMYFSFSGFIIILFFALLFYYQYSQKKKAYLLLDKKNKEILEKRNEIIKAKERAEESDKLKSTFLSNISHELRTPLNGILGFAEILQKEITDPVYKEMSEIIHVSGMRLLDTLNSIIDLSVIENNKLELYITSFNLIDLIREKALLYKVIASNKNLEIIKACQYDQILVHSDPKILANILNNLIDNAVKYTKEGRITVEAGIDDEQQKPVVWVRVEDTGIGIPESRLDHIFDRFTQVSEGQGREFEGAGLGLTICKKYIEILHGDISVTSELGRGSQFSIRFPASINISNLDDNPDEDIYDPDHSVSGNKPRILLIDNDKESLQQITKQLNQLCNISTASDPDTALVLALENNYDGVLMDVNLNMGSNGKMITHEIHKLNNHLETPITAIFKDKSHYQEQDQLQKNGFSFQLHKPCTAIGLQDVVYEMISVNT